MRRYLFPLFAITLVIMSLLFAEQVARAVVLIGYAVAGVIAATAVLAGVFGGWFVVEKLRFLRAARLEAEKQAHVLMITDNGETWVRDTDKNATWRNLTGTPALYVNGRYQEPSSLEVDLYRYRLAMQQSRPNVITGSAELLPPAAPPVDLLTALDGVQRGLIVGASNSGKTTLLQWLVYRRRQVSKVVVIDPHGWPGKWGGCYVIGTGRNYHDIGLALAALVQIMTRRYDEIGRGVVREGQHPGITILIDEWRAIVQQLGKPASEAIKSLLTESRKAAFSVFVASHSDRARPLGLEGEYDLKDGFALVRLLLVEGQRQATLNLGDGDQPAALPGPFVLPAESEAGPPLELDLTPKPTSQEAQILALHQAGHSLSEIARQVYGSKGGKQINQIKEVLERFN